MRQTASTAAALAAATLADDAAVTALGATTASNAARDLYGAGSTQYNAVNAAWAGVKVS